MSGYLAHLECHLPDDPDHSTQHVPDVSEVKRNLKKSEDWDFFVLKLFLK